MDTFVDRWDKKVIESWGALAEVIDPLIVYITNRETALKAQLNKAKQSPSLDTAFIITKLDGQIEVLIDLRREINFMTDLYKKEVANDRKGHS